MPGPRRSAAGTTSAVLATLKACGSSKDLIRGKLVHAEIINLGLQSDLYIASSVVDMYSKCGSLSDAKAVFDEMPARDTITWNALILGYARNGHELCALKSIPDMQCEDGCHPDYVTFTSAAKACVTLAGKEVGRCLDGKVVKLESLRKAMKVHAEATRRGWDVSRMVASSFIDMYCRCGSVLDARRVFDCMVSHDVVSWTALILGCAEGGEPGLALEMFRCMSCPPNARSFVAALKAVAVAMVSDVERLALLTEVHSEARERGCETDLYVACSLVSAYGKCGSMEEAQEIFNKVSGRDTVLWNSLIVGYAENGEEDVALKVLTRMRSDGRDAVSFSAALSACGSLASREEEEFLNGRFVKVKSLEKGMEVHRLAAACGLEASVGSDLVRMYAKCGSLEESQKVFDSLHQYRSVGLWTTLMLGYVENDDPETAVLLFERFHVEKQVAVDEDVGRVFVAALKACIALAEKKQVDGNELLEQGMRIYSRALECGCRSDVYVASALVTFYSKCGSVVEARRVVDSIEQPDLVLWNSLMVGYVENGEAGAALDMFARLTTADWVTYSAALNACSALAESEQGTRVDGHLVKLNSLERGMSIHSKCRLSFEDDMVVSSSLISMYAKCGSLTDACKVLEKLQRVDVVLWSSLILGCAESRQGKLGLEIAELFPGTKDCWFLVAVLKACISVMEEGGDAKVLALEKGMEVHREALKVNFESNTYLANSLVEMYCKCGSMRDARAVFDRMNQKNSAVGTALILGYIQNGEASMALETLACLRRTCDESQLDTQLFIAALKACRVLVAFEVGVDIHREVLRLGLESTVVSSLVDLYGKCGRMVNAEQVFGSAPVTSDPVTWSALLSGYSRQGRLKEVFRLVRSMQEEGVVINSSAAVGVLSVCSHTGFVEEGRKWFERVVKLEGSLEGAGLQQIYGCMVDMLSRGNEVEAAVKVIKGMPCVANAEMWRSILSASCRVKNVELAKTAFNSLLAFHNQDSAAYALMASL